MFTRYCAVLLVGSALVAAPAFAQNADTKAGSETGEWQASKLIHLNVYNDNNEKVGDIKELMLEKSGKVTNVVVGVGGFLGMGEHDVAVKFEQLKWVNEPVSNASASNSSGSTTNRPAGATTSGTAGTASTNTRSDNSNRNYPDHAVLNATKDQLKAMPEFKYNK